MAHMPSESLDVADDALLEPAATAGSTPKNIPSDDIKLKEVSTHIDNRKSNQSPTPAPTEIPVLTLKRTHAIGAALGFILLCVLGGSYFWYQGEKQKRSAEIERVKIEAEAQIQVERKRTEEAKQAVANAELKAAAKETSRAKQEKDKGASEAIVRQRAPQLSAQPSAQPSVQPSAIPQPVAQPALQPVAPQPAVQAPVQPSVVKAPASPREFCEGKPNFISKGICDKRECEKPQYFDSGYCKAYRELSSRNRSAEN